VTAAKGNKYLILWQPIQLWWACGYRYNMKLMMRLGLSHGWSRRNMLKVNSWNRSPIYG